MTSISCSSTQTWITQFNLQTMPRLPSAFVYVHQMVPPWLWWQHLVAAYYSFINPERMKGCVCLVGYLQQMVYPHKWSPVSCRSSAGQGKLAGRRPTFYCGATQPTNPYFAIPRGYQRFCSMLNTNVYTKTRGLPNLTAGVMQFDGWHPMFIHAP